MADLVNTSVTIRFTNVGQVGSDPVNLVLDDALNVDPVGNLITQFTSPGLVYFLVFSGSAYDVYSSGGTTKKMASKVPQDIVEQVEFSMTTEATLNYDPKMLTYEWVGVSSTVSVQVNGRSIKLSKPVVGILKCSYTAYADRWRLNYTETVTDSEGNDVLLVAISELGGKGTLTVNFRDPDYEEAKAYQLRVLDLCSDEPLANANVYFNNSYIGVTNEQGMIYLGILQKGFHYDLKVTKEGYISSDVDNIKNDGFTLA